MRTPEVERLKSQLDFAAALGPETAIMTTQETVRAVLTEVDPVYVTADGSHVTGERAVDLYDDEKACSARVRDEREEQRQRAEAAEARVAELEAQNARLREALTKISESNLARWNHFAVKLKKIAREALTDGKAAPS